MSGVSAATSGVSLPFYGQSSAAESTAPASTTSSPQDIVDIQSDVGGSFTADANDAFSLSSLYTASGTPAVAYKVALSDNSGANGELVLNGKDVTGQTSFTADQFASLQYKAGAQGSNGIVVVAQSGTLQADGTISNEVDSAAVQLTANVTGTRSLGVASALLTQPTGTDADEIAIAQSASIFTGFNGAVRPGVTTVGNFTSAEKDVYSVSDLFNATAPSGGNGIVSYKVALGDSSGGDGQLLLNGTDVTGQTTFTADQFSKLQYVSGASGSSESLEVVAQSGTVLAGGAISNEIDSPAVQITNSVTGTRSINAANALLTTPGGTDAASIAIAQSANIFTGFNGAARPTLATVGDFTAAAADTFSVSTLFTATAPSGNIAGYKVALGDSSGDNGELLLNGKDVTGQTSFTADEFANLQYVAGASGSSQTLEVVAQTGTKTANGSILNEVDSPAVQINASVTGTRSINAEPALLTKLNGTDAAAIAIAQQATIFTGFNGAARPTLTTVGNFSSAPADNYSVSDLFNATPPSGGGAIVGYKVALGDSSGANGQLLLDGQDVTGQTSFTADQFTKLKFVSGATGSSQSLVVIAQSGTLSAGGAIANEIDSPAVQITNSVTGTRSINAANALLTQPKGTDAASISIAQSANIFGGLNGAARPSLTTAGNFTAEAADTYSLSGLYTAASPQGAIVGYRVALGDNSGSNGQLLLNGQDVTGRTSFTADEFAALQFKAGAANSSQSIEVVAQSGTLNKDGTIGNEVDSPAVQINASVTGARSLNAAAALLTTLKGTDAAAISIAQQASIFTGFNGATRPTLTAIGDVLPAAQPLTSANPVLGAFQSTVPLAHVSANLLQGAIGVGASSQAGLTTNREATAEAALLLALSNDEIGGSQSSAATSILQLYAYAAYQSSGAPAQASPASAGKSA